MKPRLVFAIALLVLAVGAALAQKSPNGFKYDLSKEVKLKGTVEEAREFQCPVSGGNGAHILLKTQDGKTVTVHLALVKFLKEFGVSLAKGDEVEVTGVMTKVGEADALLARKIDKGNQSYTFRDKEGKPLW